MWFFWGGKCWKVEVTTDCSEISDIFTATGHSTYRRSAYGAMAVHASKSHSCGSHAAAHAGRYLQGRRVSWRRCSGICQAAQSRSQCTPADYGQVVSSLGTASSLVAWPRASIPQLLVAFAIVADSLATGIADQTWFVASSPHQVPSWVHLRQVVRECGVS